MRCAKCDTPVLWDSDHREFHTWVDSNGDPNCPEGGHHDGEAPQDDYRDRLDVMGAEQDFPFTA